jgi:hypothetical protein
MLRDGYIGAPPTVTVRSPFIWAKVGDATTAVMASAAAVAARVIREKCMVFSL